MSNANKPAFPFIVQDISKCQAHDGGLTKRELFAAMAMQGMLASESDHFNYGHIAKLAEAAVLRADALLAELERTHD